ncbi:hypothetical protein HY486_01300 [Candidatus Woesearchaeota archaeon]|nr:hypothetical protein [Candidatus Woesearchaeota archaeon]
MGLDSILAKLVLVPLLVLNQDAHGSQLPVFKNYESLKYQKYDSFVEEECAYWNAYFSTRIPAYKPINPKELIKMMALKEGGNYAWEFDPMQISNKGDTALTELKDGTLRILDSRTNAWLQKQFSVVSHASHYKGRWQYEGTGINPYLSIRGGIVYLISEKAAIFNKVGRCIGMRSWVNTVQRYNGGGDKNYIQKIFGKMATVGGKTYAHFIPKPKPTKAKNLAKPKVIRKKK